MQAGRWLQHETSSCVLVLLRKVLRTWRRRSVLALMASCCGLPILSSLLLPHQAALSLPQLSPPSTAYAEHAATPPSGVCHARCVSRVLTSSPAMHQSAVESFRRTDGGHVLTRVLLA